jgi:RNase P/RNase MRP subunit POP5
MVVKAKRGRRRYIAFTASPPSSLTPFAFSDVARMAKEMSGAADVKPVQHHGGVGIVRTSWLDQRKVTEALNAIGAKKALGFEIETVLASGTLRTLREALGVPRPPKDRNRRTAPRAPKKT